MLFFSTPLWRKSTPIVHKNESPGRWRPGPLRRARRHIWLRAIFFVILLLLLGQQSNLTQRGEPTFVATLVFGKTRAPRKKTLAHILPLPRLPLRPSGFLVVRPPPFSSFERQTLQSCSEPKLLLIGRFSQRTS